MNKKGALELSINTIIIVVLAMTLLGLGLGFINNMFEDIGATTGEVQELVKEKILDDLRSGDKKLSFPSSRLTIEGGDKKDLAIGVKNTGDSELVFKIVIQEKIDGVFTDIIPTTKEAGTFFWDDSDQTLGIGDSRVYSILHQGETTKDTYLYKLVIIKSDDTEYDSKSFFITIV